MSEIDNPVNYRDAVQAPSKYEDLRKSCEVALESTDRCNGCVNTAINLVAIEMAKLGFEVLPVDPDTKKPYKSQKFAGTKWGKTSDPEQVESDWKQWPNANLGVAAGPGSGIWVIDLDLDSDEGLDGFAEFSSLARGKEPIPKTVMVNTPRGGRHYWFKWPDGGNVGNSASVLAPGIDVRGEGGFVVAPPSEKPGVGFYQYVKDHAPWEVEVAQAPAWLLEKVRESGLRRTASVAPAAESADNSGPVVRAALKHKAESRIHLLMQQLQDVEVGKRNDTLNRTAYEIGRLAHHLDSNVAVQKLLDGIPDWPEPEKSRETAERAFRDGRSKGPPPVVVNLDDLLLSHEDLAQYAFETALGKDIIYVHEWGWHEWNGHTWTAITDKLVEGKVAAHLCSVQSEIDIVAAAEAERARANAVSGNTVGARSARKVLARAKVKRNALGSIQFDKAVTQKLAAKVGKNAQDFNADPVLLGTPGGVVDLRSGRTRPGHRDDLISRSTAVIPSDTTPERWIQVLGEAFPAQPEMVEFLQRLAGVCLTGLTRDEKFFFLYGTGRNGKGVFMETLLYIMGDYSAKASADVFLSSVRAESTQNDLALMDGARLVWGDEIPVGRKWDTATIKNLTGGDTIVAKRLYRDKFIFKPQATIFIAGNTKPRITGVDVAIRERMVLVPFEQTFSKGKADPNLKRYLADQEAGGILSWAIEGARKYLEDGLMIPDTVQQASADYLESEDAVMQFVEDCCVVEESGFIASKALHDVHKAWAEIQGCRAVGQRTLTRMLNERGFTQHKRDGVRGLRGLRPKDGDEEKL